MDAFSFELRKLISTLDATPFSRIPSIKRPLSDALYPKNTQAWKNPRYTHMEQVT
jgi:hypothetical protein